ncbi:MAG: 50S ribosomal protein L15 [Bacteroidetes bacterium]|nr:MAG: 50S ribosomal protein L15 [Bacteroidota bacterium]
MELHNLKPAEGSTHSDRRLGRGQGSGKGGTSTRGHKGQKSRSGYSRKIGFEGGQMPLQRRVPKFGFKNINRKEYKGINLGILQALAEKSGISEFTPEVMINAGLVSKNTLIKILGKGELKAQLVVKAHAFSESAKTAIEAAKGTAEKI